MGIAKRIVIKATALWTRKVAWVVLWFLARYIDLPLWLHVGATKTGTTTLQHDIFSYHPQIEYFGMHNRRDYYTGNRLNIVEAIFLDAFVKLFHVSWSVYYTSRARGLGRESNTTRAKLFLLSNESMSLVCRRPFPPKATHAKTKVLYVIRNEVNHLHTIWLASAYRRAYDGKTSLGFYTADDLARDAGLSITNETKLTTLPGYPSRAIRIARENVYSPAEFIRKVGFRLGKELYVLPYELFAEEPKTYLDKISNLMGIDPKVTWKLYRHPTHKGPVIDEAGGPARPGRQRTALRQRGLEFCRHFKHSWPTYDADPKLFFKTAEEYAATLPTKPRRAFTKALAEIKSKPYGSSCRYIRKLRAEPQFGAWLMSGEEAKVEFSAETLARLREIRAPQNRWLAEKFNLDLKRYGYAM